MLEVPFIVRYTTMQYALDANAVRVHYSLRLTADAVRRDTKATKKGHLRNGALAPSRTCRRTSKSKGKVKYAICVCVSTDMSCASK